MRNKFKNREWVKTAAIIFLAALLVLTFFSNTIMNHSLTEVATQEVTNGSITAKVRGTGTVSAIGNTEIKATGTTNVASVRVKEGQEVKAGDTLIIYGDESEELETALEELDELKYSLMRAQNSYPTTSVSDASLQAARIAESEAQEEFSIAEEKYNRELTEEEKNYLAEIESEENIRLDAYNAALISGESKRNDARTEYEKAKAEYEADPTDEKKAAMEAASANYNTTCELCDTEENTAYNAYTAVKEKYEEIEATFRCSAEYEIAKAKLESAQSVLSDAEAAYYSAAASSSQSATSAWINTLEVQNKIAKAEEKVAKLSGGEENPVTAPVSGTISAVNTSPGSTVAKGDILVVIEVPDMGHQVSFSVTNDQAKRLKVGDTASVSNYYWGSEIIATLSSIKVDPKNPQTNKLLTFDLDGDVDSGSELTVAIGQKSANYDTIVPYSAVRTDSNGSFVLKIEAKNSALGNRYFAKRVSVEVLATDDVSSAVNGDISYGDFVITTSSAPISSGDQVRMSDTE